MNVQQMQDFATALGTAMATQLAQLMATANNQQQQQQPAPQGQQQQPVAAFAMTPAQAIQGPFDFTNKTAQIVYKQAIESLYGKDEDSFAAEEKEVNGLVNRLTDRASDQGWANDLAPAEGLLNVPTAITAGGAQQPPFHNMLNSYGEVAADRIKRYEIFINGTNNRRKQQLGMLYKCLMASLTKEAAAKINVWRDQFLHEDHQGRKIQGGISLLKVMIRESGSDSGATVQSLRNQLSMLDEFALAVKGDVTKINAKAKTIIEGLEARGATTTELRTNLFKAYKSIHDQNFQRYIEIKEDASNEAETPIGTNELMNMAAEKYKAMVEKGEWQAPSEDTEKILALQTEIEKLKKRTSNGRASQSKGNGSGKSNSSPKKLKPDWLFKNERPPDDELHKPREWNGQKYYYCAPETGGKCTGKWRLHKPKECKGKEHVPEHLRKRGKTDSESAGNKNSKKSKPVSASEAVQEAESDCEE